MSLSYLTITAYKDKSFSSKIGTYTVMINPEKYTQNSSVEYSTEQGQGAPGTTIKYKKTTPQTISFVLVFDGTGVVSSKRTDLVEEIDQFKKLVYDYNGEIHSPNYLELKWGAGLSFECKLTSMSTDYTLFRPDGKPLRAKVTVNFKGYKDPQMIEAEADKSSPDLTHLVTVVAGDTLPGLSYKIYGDTGYYLQVARFNNINNFRNIKPGTVIQFPPLT
ncbi:MAG: hypothetical protein AAFZ15_23460 [Bacteroidota bacterium]